MTWLLDTLRFIGMVFVRMVFWLVEQLLQTIVDLANAPLFSDTIIDIFSRRIYVILGLVMVFKLMISFIQILIDPDAMSDKEKGVGNVLKRVVISMALIVLVPSIFKMARDVQGYILPIIPKVVLGIQSDQNIDDPVSSSNIGSVMAWYSFLPFFDYQNEACNDGSIQKLVGDDTSTYEIYSVSTAADNINTKDSCSTNSNKYKYQCNGIVIVVGAFLLFAFVQVAVQIAIRTIKFGICELVAPIPIASYIDPKTSKSTFDKWVHTSIKVYLDLFIQLIAIYFVVFVFQTFVSNVGTMGAILQNVGNDMWRASLVILFIIIGLTQFIKQFPKFLSDMLGISSDGSIGKLFKDTWEGAKTTGRWLGDSAKIMRSNYTTQRERAESQGKNDVAKLRGVGSAIAGFGSYQGRMIKNKLSGKNGKDLTTSSYKGAIEARNRRNYNNDVVFQGGYTRKDYRKEKRRQALGIPSTNDFYTTRSSSYNEMLSAGKDLIQYGNEKKEERRGNIMTGVLNPDTGADMSLSELRMLSQREVGEYKTGRQIMVRNPKTRKYEKVDETKYWTEADKAKYDQAVSDAEKRLKYSEAEYLVHTKKDSVALTKVQKIQQTLNANKNLFYDQITDASGNKRSMSDVFLNKFNAQAGTSYTNIEDFYNDVNNNPTDTVNAKFLEAYKSSFEEIIMLTNNEAAAAQARKKAFQQADNNNSK